MRWKGFCFFDEGTGGDVQLSFAILTTRRQNCNPLKQEKAALGVSVCREKKTTPSYQREMKK